MKCSHLVKLIVTLVRLFNPKSSLPSKEDEKFGTSVSESREPEFPSSDGAPVDSEEFIKGLLSQLVEDSLSLCLGPSTEVSRPPPPVQVFSSLEDCPAISTPEDLPRLKARPAQPSKSLPSPAPADAQLAKRSLFDSPAPSRPSTDDGQGRLSRVGFTAYRSSALLPDVDTPVKVCSNTPKSVKSALVTDVDTPGKVLSDTPKSVKFSDKSPERISPQPFVETHTATDVEFLLMKIRSMKVEEEAKAPEPEVELSFALPSRLDLPDLSMDMSDVFEAHGDLLPLVADGERSVLASHGGDLAFRPPALSSTSTMESSMKANVLATLALQHGAQLLEKDREIAALQKKLLGTKVEAAGISGDIKKVEERMTHMALIIGQFEETKRQINTGAEDEMSGLQRSREKASRECKVAQDDLQVLIYSKKD